MLFKDIQNSPFFTEQRSADDNQTRLYPIENMKIEFGCEHYISYIEHNRGDSHITIFYKNGNSISVSIKENLHFGVYKLVHILNL